MASASLAMRRRLAASLLMAAALHVGILAGLDWPSLPDGSQMRPIRLTLTGHRTPQRVEVEREGLAPRVKEPGDQVAAPAASSTAPPAEAANVVAKETAPVVAPTPNPIAGRSIAELARAVAASDAAPQVPALGRFNSASRTLRLTTGASARADFAYYLRSWRRKVERIGRLNYPRQAQQQGIVGSLRLLVVLSADGALQNARVLESSGHRVLDEAALAIVYLAAPYAPFSPSMREAADVLEIERTWQFRNSGLSS